MKNWSLTAKIYFVLAITIAANIFSVGLGLNRLSAINDAMSNINNSLYKRIEHLSELNILSLRMAIRVRDFMLTGDGNLQQSIAEELKEKRNTQEKEIEEFSKIASEQGKADILKYRDLANNWFATSEEVMTLIREKKTQEAVSMSENKMAPARKAMVDNIEKIIDINKKRMNDAAAESDAEYKSTRLELSLLSLVAMAVSLGIAFVMIRSFSKEINSIIASLNENAAQVASASTQIASSSEELSQATTEQASSLEETAASLEEIGAMIAKASENANSTASNSAESQNKAEEGKTAVDEMLNSMNEISQSNDAIVNQVNHSNQQMNEIVKVIQLIAEKTKVINDIVFQTKLLSFNASVEAARAGEHGQGFAVVAEEVGKLAQMSGNAAKDIADMLAGSVSKVEGIVVETKTKVESLVAQGKLKIGTGIDVSRKCSTILNEIVNNVSTVSALSQEISQASREQAGGVTEINKAMSQLDSVTQQNSATSEEAASAAEQLSAQAESLKNVVSQLVVSVRGGQREDHVQQQAAPVTRTKTSNVVHLKSNSVQKTNKFNNPSPSKLKVAAGDGKVPDRDDAGFRDV